MRIRDLHPHRTPFGAGRTRRAGSNRSWGTRDYWEAHCRVRDVYHYDTLMLRFNGDGTADPAWFAVPMSLGHGTVSDQQGVNQLLSGSRYRYSRAGGAACYIVTRA